MRVLIVDDDRTSRLVLRRVLEAIGGVEVTEAVDGADALRILSDGLAPGLIFIDINMPRMNGVELLKRIREDERTASLKVCICTAVRDRRVVAQTAPFQPEQYILKPYSRTAITEQIQRARGEKTKIADPIEEVCSRLGIDRPDYARMLDSLLVELRDLSKSIPTLTTQAQVSDAIMVLDGAKSSAESLGAHQAAAVSEELTRFIKSGGSAVRGQASKEGASSVTAWLAGATEELLQSIERLAAAAAKPIASPTARPDPTGPRFRPDLDFMIRFLTGTLQRGRMFTSAASHRLRALDLSIDLKAQPAEPGSTTAPSESDAPMVLTMVDDATADAIEECCGIWDLLRLLSYPYRAGKRWMPDGAIRLLEEETAHRNEHGLGLLRQAVGPNVDRFLAQREPLLRQKLHRMLSQAPGHEPPSAERVQQILEQVRFRLHEALKGRLVMQPDFTPVDLGNLAESAEEALWTGPHSILHHAALLFRNAARDSSFYRVFKFNTFYRESFVQAMDLFGDLMAHDPDPDRGLREKYELDAIAAGEEDLREKSLKIWRLVRAEALATGFPMPRADGSSEK